jgi:ParB/RepB/Spo0J family partition protein
MAGDNDREIATWQLAKLMPHPKQCQLFGHMPEHEIQELADDLRRNGQLQPLEILPDGTIVAGHRRTEAAKLLGWDQVDVWVRHDLADDPVAVERRLIEDNLHRRQLGPMGKARCYLRLKELEGGDRGGRLPDHEWKDLRDRLGKRLGGSGRNLDRYLRILNCTPQEVQDAVEAGRLPLTLAYQVVGLKVPQKELIARQIREGGNPKTVVTRAVGKKDSKHKRARDAKAAFLKALERGRADLNGRVQEVGWVTAEEQKTLQEGANLIKSLQQRARKQPKRPPSLDTLLGLGEDEE